MKPCVDDFNNAEYDDRGSAKGSRFGKTVLWDVRESGFLLLGGNTLRNLLSPGLGRSGGKRPSFPLELSGRRFEAQLISP